MNGKLVFRTDFSDCLNYVLSKEGAKLISTNMTGQTASELAAEFHLIARQSSRIQKPVMHLSLSPHPDDRLSEEEKLQFSQKLFEALGMGQCQWVLVEHNDTTAPDGQPRPHLHAVGNRIPTNDRKAVNSSWIKKRTELALQNLRLQFGLREVIPSWSVERKAPSTGLVRRYRTQKEHYEKGERTQPPELPALVQFQNAIDSAAVNSSTMPELLEQLQEKGINAKILFTRNDLVKGIVYERGKYHFSGSQLGRAYSFPGLQKYRNVDYQPSRDNEALKAFQTPVKEAIASDSKKRQSASAGILAKENAPSNDFNQSHSTQPKNQPSSPETNTGSTSQWEALRQHLFQQYGLPQELSSVLKEQGNLYANSQGEAVWVKKPYKGQQKDGGAFWIATGSTVDRAVITDSPIEAVSAFLVEEERQQSKPTLYLSLEKVSSLPKDFLEKLNEVAVGIADNAFAQEVTAALKNATRLEVDSPNETWQQMQQQKQVHKQIEL